MMRTGKHFKDVRTADRSTPTSTPRFITYKPQVTVRTTPTTSMYLTLIIALLGILLYMAYRIHSSVSSLSETTKKLTEDSLKTIGGLYPVFSQHEMVEARKRYERFHEEYNKVAQHYLGLNEEKILREELNKGKSLDGLKAGVDVMYERLAPVLENKVEYEQMALANLDVFHGRKTIEQAQEETVKASGQYRWGGVSWNELMKGKEEYIGKIEATYTRLTG